MSRLLLSALLCAAVACGGSGSPKPSASPTPTPMTKEAYLAAANALCARVQTEGDAVPEPTTPAEYESALTSLVGILDRAQADLRALRPPVADAAAIDQHFLRANDAQAAALKAALPNVRSAAQSNDARAAEQAFGEAISAFSMTSEADLQWTREYGLTECV